MNKRMFAVVGMLLTVLLAAGCISFGLTSSSELPLPSSSEATSAEPEQKMSTDEYFSLDRTVFHETTNEAWLYDFSDDGIYRVSNNASQKRERRLQATVTEMYSHGKQCFYLTQETPAALYRYNDSDGKNEVLLTMAAPISEIQGDKNVVFFWSDDVLYRLYIHENVLEIVLTRPKRYECMKVLTNNTVLLYSLPVASIPDADGQIELNCCYHRMPSRAHVYLTSREEITEINDAMKQIPLANMYPYFYANRDRAIFPVFSYKTERENHEKAPDGVRFDGFQTDITVESAYAAEAIYQARKVCTIQYADLDVFYDAKAAVWKIVFYEWNNRKHTQSVYINTNGVVEMLVERS